jgi:peptidyl-tRNA hydrolase
MRRKLSFQTKDIKTPELLVLYVLVRTDMASMSSGRSAAQVGHATTQFEFDASNSPSNDPEIDALRVLSGITSTGPVNPALDQKIAAWKASTRGGFGTQIVLNCPSAAEMYARVEKAQAANVHAGIVNDPEYFVQDGRAFHPISVDTCAYIFGRKDECFPFVGDMALLMDKDFLNR